MHRGKHDTPPEIAWASDALRDVATERRRQIEAKGRTLEHDDQHAEGALSLAASGYAMTASDQIQAVANKWDHDSSLEEFVTPPTAYEAWPNGWEFKRCTPRQALVKAGALILAEIERLDRLQPSPPRREETAAPPKTNPLDRATDLHEKSGMPWEQAEKLALEEDMIGDAEIDELIGNATSHAIVGLLGDEEVREFARSILVHQYALKPNAEAQGRR